MVVVLIRKVLTVLPLYTILTFRMKHTSNPTGCYKASVSIKSNMINTIHPSSGFPSERFASLFGISFVHETATVTDQLLFTTEVSQAQTKTKCLQRLRNRQGHENTKLVREWNKVV